MRVSSKSHGKNNDSIFSSAHSQRGKESEALRNIMNSIKYLQQRVSHLPDCQAPKKIQITPSTPKIKPNTNHSLSKPKKQSSKKRISNIKTKRDDKTKRDSLILNINSKTCKMRRDVVVDVQQTCDKPQLLENYMSLQLQNCKLQKHNLNLQKQLLEQELLMERRQKQLLKQRLKRMKTHHQELSEKTTPQQNKNFNTPKTYNIASSNQKNNKDKKVSAFQISPIKIKIPSLGLQNQQNLNCLMPSKTKQFNADEDVDSLLLSQESEKRKSQEAMVLDEQLWELLGQNKPKKLTNTRQVLGDIANRPKILRRR